MLACESSKEANASIMMLQPREPSLATDHPEATPSGPFASHHTIGTVSFPPHQTIRQAHPFKFMPHTALIIVRTTTCTPSIDSDNQLSFTIPMLVCKPYTHLLRRVSEQNMDLLAIGHSTRAEALS